MNESTRDLLVRGIAALKGRDFSEARRYLEWLLRLDPPLEQRVDALVWLAEATSDPKEKRRIIEEALAYDPSDMRARRALAILKGELKPSEIVDPERVTPQEVRGVTPQEVRGVTPQEVRGVTPQEVRGVTAPAPQDPDQADPQRFVCPQCGGRMTYAPDGRSLTCEYCEARQSLADETAQGGGQAAESFLIAMATRKGHLHPSARQTFACRGCGIDFLLPPQQLTLTCPYCGSAYAVRQPAARDLIDPHRIIPFTIDENAARQAFKTWLAQNLPDAEARAEKGTALYLPAWSFEIAGQVPWTALVQQSRNHWAPESGIEIVYHAALLEPATRSLSAECAAELQTFDARQALPFDERFLANWPAETYQVNVGDASLEARRRAYAYEQAQVRARFLRPVKELSFNSLGITIESFALILLPFWICHYRLAEGRFEVVINGQTGAVRGQQPGRKLGDFLGRLLQ